MRLPPLLFALGLLIPAFGVIFESASAKDGPVASPEKDWPQWRGPRRDGISEETGLLKKWPKEGPPLVWKKGDLGRGWSSPIIIGEQIFISGDKDGEVLLHCLDLSGTPLWVARNGGAWTSNYAGSRASCAYSEGVVYHMNAHGRVAAYDAASGSELWSVANLLQEFEAKNINWGLSECLLVDGPRLIASPTGTKALLVALDKKSGRTLWSAEPIPGDTAAYVSPVLVQIGQKRVLLGNTSHHGYGVDADTGALLWKVPVRNNWGASCCAPVYHEGAVFYAAPDGAPGTLYRINLNASPVSTEVLWRTHVEPLTGGAIFKEGLLFTNGCKKSRALHALDWSTGESRFELQLSSPTNNHATGALLWAEDRLYALFENGIVALLRPAKDRFEIEGQFTLVDAPKSDAWAHPVILGGRLYLRYHEELWCFGVGAP